MKPTDNIRKPKHTIRTKIFSALAIVIVIALALLWLAQVVLFDIVYSNVRISEVEATARHIKLFANKSTFFRTISDAAAKNDICADIISEDGSVVYEAENTATCLIHTMTASERREFIALADENTLFSVNYNTVTEEYAVDTITGSLLVSASNILYMETVEHNGEVYYLILDASVAPVGTVKKASASFLIVLSLILIAVAVVLANFLAKKIADPIGEISRQAKKLSSGSYTAVESHSAELDELNESLLAASRDLQEVERLRTELVANLSHDLRTPLTLIGGYAEMMRDLPSEITEENLDTIVSETRRLTSLVNDMMDVSLLENGRITPTFEAFDLSLSLSELLDSYQKLTLKDGYRFILETPAPSTVYADRTMIRQVITNLLNNAMTYTGEDKTITVRQSISENYVRVEVIDTGEGIAPDKLPMIWERYYKVDSAHKRAAKGTGLGLSIVRQVITLHGGRYGVRSTPGKGSTFWFELPLADSPSQA
ncbi:MAG: two-component sensor histidine kinase [Clostridia bacterium]|nr:two-component sensor histidine kinase [Clostridia bacterium]